MYKIKQYINVSVRKLKDLERHVLFYGWLLDLLTFTLAGVNATLHLCETRFWCCNGKYFCVAWPFNYNNFFNVYYYYANLVRLWACTYVWLCALNMCVGAILWCYISVRYWPFRQRPHCSSWHAKRLFKRRPQTDSFHRQATQSFKLMVFCLAPRLVSPVSEWMSSSSTGAIRSCAYAYTVRDTLHSWIRICWRYSFRY